MKVPGRPWPQFRVVTREEGRAQFSQVAVFAPGGLLGLLYGYALCPIHGFSFSGLIDCAARRAVAWQADRGRGCPRPGSGVPMRRSCAGAGS